MDPISYARSLVARKASSKNIHLRKVFPFLDLPAELRDNIYKYVAEGETICLESRGRGNAISRSAMLRLNRQIHQEFMPILNLYAPIVSRSQNFGFRHIVTFWNKLDDLELQSLLTTIDGPAVRSVHINISTDHYDSAHGVLLRRWVKQAGYPAKKCTKIEVLYVVVDNIATSSNRSFEVWEKVGHLMT